MDGPMRGVAGTALRPAEEVRAGIESGGHRRHAGEGFGSQFAASAQGTDLAVSRGSPAYRGGLRLHRHAGTSRTGAFLKNYRGHLQADAYVAYDSFFTDPQRE